MRLRHLAGLLLLSGSAFLLTNLSVTTSDHHLPRPTNILQPTSVAHAIPAALASPPPPLPSVLPRHVPCIELRALASCLSTLQNPWPNSSDWACADDGIVRLARCPQLVAASATVDWSAVVFGFPIHNSLGEEELIRAAAQTWLPLTAGADVLLATDKDDPRTYARLQNLIGVDTITTQVTRCPVCCSGGRKTPGKRDTGLAAEVNGSALGAVAACDGTTEGPAIVREGWMARTKVLVCLHASNSRLGRWLPHPFLFDWPMVAMLTRPTPHL